METSIYIKERLAEIERSISKAKGKFREDLKNVRIYGTIMLVCTIFIVLDFSSVLDIATWLKVIMWIVGIFFGLAILGTDLNKNKAEIESQESVRNVFLGLPEPTNDTNKYFDKLVKINVENLAAYYYSSKSTYLSKLQSFFNGWDYRIHASDWWTCTWISI